MRDAKCPWCLGTGTHKGVGLRCRNPLYHPNPPVPAPSDERDERSE